MQTFLPYDDFALVAEVLDWKRLGKQRLEARQILNALDPRSTSKWKNHPAVRMWKGYEKALQRYLNLMIDQWVYRGYKNTMASVLIEGDITYPPWLGDERLHSSHRARLLSKDFEYYSKLGWVDDPNAPYWWPVELKNKKMNREMNEYWNKFMKDKNDDEFWRKVTEKWQKS